MGKKVKAKNETEAGLLIKQFWEQKKNETKKFFVLPIVIAILIGFWINNILLLIETFDIKEFINSYLTLQITILALFISFSMGYVTILVTGTGSNIEKLKMIKSKSITMNGEKVYLYQILLNDFTYNILVQAVLLMLSFVHFFIVGYVSNVINIILLSMQFGIIMHIIILIVTNMINIYFAFWNCEHKD